ncbi:MAG: hypothetical protein EA343_08165 [Nodularia sp. (in: Bacteria)]|nr:MAG: hypothetical protein EA343_08165 [Nodularia sp. (in: cyanobacteria)]
MEQHYRLTLSDAIAKYQGGDLTAKGLVHFYILIRCKPGWKIRLEHQKVCKELGIQKTAFYNAISRLREEGSINWEAPQGILVSLSISESFRECGMDSASAETESAIAEYESASAETESAIADSKSPDALDNGQFGDYPDLLTTSYQLFINSLSENERENFLDFGKKKAAELKNPPVQLPLKWIEKNFDELRSQWEKLRGVVRGSKWESDPRRQEWLDKIRSLGFAGFIFEDGNLDKQRKEFYQWANSHNLIWGDKT